MDLSFMQKLFLMRRRGKSRFNEFSIRDSLARGEKVHYAGKCGIHEIHSMEDFYKAQKMERESNA
jgi:hypothetical protein